MGSPSLAPPAWTRLSRNPLSSGPSQDPTFQKKSHPPGERATLRDPADQAGIGDLGTPPRPGTPAAWLPSDPSRVPAPAQPPPRPRRVVRVARIRAIRGHCYVP